MITRRVHIAVCLLVACLSSRCVAEERVAKPAIEGTWVLKAIATSDKDLHPVKDDQYLRFVFDDANLHIHLRGMTPRTVRYRLQEYPGQEYTYFLQFTTRHDVGWTTTPCRLDHVLIMVLSDADNLLPKPIGMGDRDTAVCFVFERAR